MFYQAWPAHTLPGPLGQDPILAVPLATRYHRQNKPEHTMHDQDTPQLYLVSPTAFDPDIFAPRLAAVLDAHDIACIRLALASEEETDVTRAADQLRDIAHARDVPIVISKHVGLVERLGLDGVHLPDGARNIRKARADLGADAIIGTYCEASSHDGMSAGEAGADYIAFGPVGETGLGGDMRAEHDLFAWWSQMIELPVVAEGGLTPDIIAHLAPVTDFFAIGAEIWRHDHPVAALGDLTAPLRA
jgi:thiamine-phosphate pyrophosphorylase